MYVRPNFKTKKALKEAVASNNSGRFGAKITRISVFAPGLGEPVVNGMEFIEGPHYPKPHSWYAQVLVSNGLVVKVLK